jgi:hypothetical protein
MLRTQPLRRIVISAVRPGAGGSSYQTREFAGISPGSDFGSPVGAPLAGERDKNGDLYSDRQSKTGRPISPYPFVNDATNAGMLTALPIVAISSLLVRVSGILLTAGTIGVASISLTGGDPAATMAAIGQGSFGPIAKAAVAWPVSYHFLGGCRHYVSDTIQVLPL